MQPFHDSTELLHDPGGLRSNAKRDGYLFFRGLIDEAPLFELRRQILELCGDAGWVDPNRDLMDGIVVPGVAPKIEPSSPYMEVYDRVQKLEAFHTFAHSPRLLAMLDRLFGEETLVHPRNIARIIFPQNTPYTTPAHQDYIHIRGTPDTYTAWIPLGECPQEMGGLAVLAGSHHGGIYETHEALGAGGRGIDTDPLPYEWHSSDFHAGDALLFHSHAVHRGLDNLSPDRLRLSVDYRYQPASQPVVADSLLPHFARMTWEEIYDGWESPAVQGYWKRFPLQIAG